MANNSNGRRTCEACGFRYLEDDMLEKEIKDKEGKVKEAKWYCRRCAPWYMG